MTGRLKCNRKGWDRIKKTLARFGEREIDVGFVKNKKYPDQKLTAAQVAYMNDQGTTTNPPRPFMSVDFPAFVRKEFKKDARDFFKLLLLKKNVAYVKELTKLAQKYELELKIIIDDYPGHNSPEWAEHKGFDDPLYHTGFMVNAVSSRVKLRSS